ncbi:MAG: ArsR/SmtB family transcription factor [Acidiferrobacteraceae bacterium]
MERKTAIRIFESLSSGVRLDIYRLLVRHAPEGLVAGQIATAVGLASNSASFHLKEMTYAGLLSVTPEGRFQRYRAELALIPDLITYLTEECCAGRPEQCLGLSIPSGGSTDVSALESSARRKS